MLFDNYQDLVDNGKEFRIKQIRKDFLDVLSYSLDAVDPYNSVKKMFSKDKIILGDKNIDLSTFDSVYLVSFGKASIGMAEAICDSVDIKEGVVVTNEKERKIKSKNIKTFVGSHPIPDENSIKAAEKILSLFEKCKNRDLLIVLISGGGSALLCKPRVKLEDIQKITDLLLKCGANINEINTIRKHISFVKGGQLVKYANCKVVSFVISDIVGDPLEFIASGPTYPDSTTFNDACKILKKYEIWEKTPDSVKKVLINGIKKEIPETPDKKDSVFKNVDNVIVANNTLACKKAIEKAEDLGYKTMILTTKLEGEAKDMAHFLVDKTVNYETNSDKMMFICGGETTVTIKGDEKGGRNQEMVLASVEKISKQNIVFCSFASDGIDGNSDAAGAIADGKSFNRAKKQGLDPNFYLKNNDSYNFFKKLGDLFFTGPTGTNIMDIQLIAKYSE